MKLYTEEQVKKVIKDSFLEGIERNTNYESVKKSIFNSLIPIELPSDEEIDVHVEDDFFNAIEVHKYSEEAQLLMKAMCKAGALWMRDKIQGDNNEQ